MRLQKFFAKLRQSRVQHDLSDELRFHLEKEIEENVARGMSAGEARRQALIAFGGVQQTREKVHALRWTRFAEILAQDFRYGLRMLARSPGFATVAVLMLALGVGGNTAIFTVVNSVLLKPLLYPNAGRLVQIQETYQQGFGTASYSNFRDWQEQNATFAQLVAYTFGNKNLQDIDSPERVCVIFATANLFDALGTRPLLGRTFVPADQDPTAPPIAVMSAGLWQRFGADPGQIGKTITLDGETYTVVGVMPDGFRFPAVSDHPAEVWLPLHVTPQQASQRGNHWLFVIGLMRPSVSMASALADLKIVAKRLEEQYPEQARRSVKLTALREYSVGSLRAPLFALLGAVGLVLLIACANLANLLLARGTARKREVAIRLALGASRARVRRQFLTESLVLALTGGLAGSAAAFAGVKALVALAGPNLPRAVEIRLDLQVFGFLFAVSLASGILFGIAPSLQSSRLRFQENLKTTGITTSRPAGVKLRSALMTGEVALSLVLLVGAGLLTRTFFNLCNTDPGFITDKVLTLHLSVPEKKYPGETAATAFYQPLLEKIHSLPGVRAAGIISLLPIQNAWTNAQVHVEGRAPDEPGKETWAELRFVSPEYFSALGIGLRRGRMFNERDTPKGPLVLLINEQLAKMCFPNEDPIGKHILFGQPWTVVGVVGNVKQARLDFPSLAEIYFPYLQVGEALHDEMTLVVRASVAPESLVGPIRNSVHSLDPGQPLADVETMQQVVAESISDRRLYMMVLGVFAGSALLLAMIGMYGVISFMVGQRTAEFGLRLALGASPSHVLGWVLKQSLQLILTGVAIGLAVSLVVTRILGGILYGVKPTDPATFIFLSLVLVGIGLAAIIVPARRATKIDPMVALRYE